MSDATAAPFAFSPRQRVLLKVAAGVILVDWVLRVMMVVSVFRPLAPIFQGLGFDDALFWVAAGLLLLLPVCGVALWRARWVKGAMVFQLLVAATLVVCLLSDVGSDLDTLKSFLRDLMRDRRFQTVVLIVFLPNAVELSLLGYVLWGRRGGQLRVEG